MSVIIPRFHEVKREQCKASIVIQGLSGRGKSGLALLIADVLTKPDKVFAIDTEKKSLNLFEGLRKSTGEATFGKFQKFDLLASYGYAPSNYLACRRTAIRAGCKVFIQDSISHAWVRVGGVLNLVETAKQRNPKLNNYTAWGDETVVTEKGLIYELFRDEEVHVISTIRLKEKHELVDGTVVSLGEQQIFMPETKYEPDLVLHMLRAGNQDGTPPLARIEKSRYAIFTEGNAYEFTTELIQQLKDYLSSGTNPEELKELQRKELIEAVTEHLNTYPNAKNIWKLLKTQAGHESTKLDDLPLEVVRKLLGKLLE